MLRQIFLGSQAFHKKFRQENKVLNKSKSVHACADTHTIRNCVVLIIVTFFSFKERPLGNQIKPNNKHRMSELKENVGIIWMISFQFVGKNSMKHILI